MSSWLYTVTLSAISLVCYCVMHHDTSDTHCMQQTWKIHVDMQFDLGIGSFVHMQVSNQVLSEKAFT